MASFKTWGTELFADDCPRIGALKAELGITPWDWAPLDATDDMPAGSTKRYEGETMGGRAFGCTRIAGRARRYG